MKSQLTKLGLPLLLAGTLISCAHTPPHVTQLSSSADPSFEISKTEEMLTQGRDKQLDVLSPNNFERAEKSLEDAKEARAKNKSNDKILKEVANARGWLDEANTKGEVAEVPMKQLLDARANAIRSGAPTAFPKDWKNLENDTMDVTEAIEKGKLPADKKTEKLISKYSELEIQTVTTNTLGKADANLKAAKKEGAEKFAPKTYSSAMARYTNAEKLIQADPRNSAAINRAAEVASFESAHALDVTKKVKATGKGNVEDFVLRDERNQRTITGLRDETGALMGVAEQSQEQLTNIQKERDELASKQATIDKANRVREQFNPNEAEVYTEGNKVMIRLKGVQFASNKATINPRSKQVLDKVETALNEFDGSKVIIEGHTDTVGTKQANMAISEKRAKAVQNYLVSSGKVDASNLEARGMGYERPITDNKTAAGRAQNRRIDLVIEAQ
jgi:Outer membrane protein and related peptidoglycan-associated (lipo)proteins